MISVDALYGIIEDGLNSKMGQVAIADKYGVGQTTNLSGIIHDISYPSTPPSLSVDKSDSLCSFLFQ
jgi:hypothetical protein